MRSHLDLRRTGHTEPPGEALGRGTASGWPRELSSIWCIVQGAQYTHEAMWLHLHRAPDIFFVP